jgi:hypothetical protein
MNKKLIVKLILACIICLAAVLGLALLVQNAIK